MKKEFNRIACLTAAMGATAAAAAPASAQVIKKGAAKGYNVVFIISDQHKLSVTGCYGDPVVKTPNIDALASTGVMFTRMYTPSPLSAPARAALITGTYPSTNGALLHQMEVEKNGKVMLTEAGKFRTGYREDMTTWGEDMKKEGYNTAAIGKMHVHGELQKGVNPDYPEGNLMGFDYSDMRFYTFFPGGHYSEWKNNPDHYARYREIKEYAELRKDNNFNQLLKPTLVEQEEDIFDFAVATKCDGYLEGQKGSGKPFLLHVGLEKPHKPWSTAQRFYDMYKPEQMTIPATYMDWHENGRYPYVRRGTHNPLTDPAEIRNVMVAYYGCVTELDEAVGRVVNKTKELGLYDKTIFVYTTDHGEHLFEHGFHEKHNMFDDAVNIPFIISCPALLPQGVTCSSLGSLIDVLPTIAEMIGAEPDPQWEGRSLLSQIGAAEPWDRVVFSEFYQDDFVPFPKKNVPLRMYLDNKYKYVYTHGMIDQLYDATGKDPDEMTNLAFEEKNAALVERYRLLTLDGWVIPYAVRMEAKVAKKGKGVTLTWKAVPEARNYTVWSSETPSVADAVKVGEVSGMSYTRGDGRAAYYWVTANWNLNRKGERKENIPMMTAEYPSALPITAMIRTE